jgi:hypothetical protein
MLARRFWRNLRPGQWPSISGSCTLCEWERSMYMIGFEGDLVLYFYLQVRSHCCICIQELFQPQSNRLMHCNEQIGMSQSFSKPTEYRVAESALI